MFFLCFSLARWKQTARVQFPPAEMSDQRKRNVEDELDEESDEEYTPDKSSSGGSGQSGSESEGKKPRAPAREVILFILLIFHQAAKKLAKEGLAFSKTKTIRDPTLRREAQTPKKAEKKKEPQKRKMATPSPSKSHMNTLIHSLFHRSCAGCNQVWNEKLPGEKVHSVFSVNAIL